MAESGLDDADHAVVRAQLGREPRGVVRVAHRCPCGAPDVLMTLPRLPDGEPFPTVYYLTCPRLASAIGTLESSGVMREFEDLLASDPQIAAAYEAAHVTYLADREALEVVPEISGISAGGMPSRVKCLHVLAAHAMASGPGVNPLGDMVLARLGDWWSTGCCVDPA